MAKRRGGGLEAMYVIAAFLMFVASIVVVVVMVLPSNPFGGGADEEVYTPGSIEPFRPFNAPEVLEAPGVRDLGGGRYLVVIEAYNWTFQPSEIRVPVGAEVTFRARSRQDYHGIAIIGTPVILSLTQNETAEVVHTFTERGEYLFVCSEYCGAGHATMQGTVIVE
jgi:cytochrome c oxidase subunit II